MNKNEQTNLKKLIQITIESIITAFDKLLDSYIKSGKYMSVVEKLQILRNDLVQNLVNYANKYKISNVCVGLSGGIDSDPMLRLFRDAGYHVIGVTMSINQIEDETDRGFETAQALGIDQTYSFNRCIRKCVNKNIN